MKQFGIPKLLIWLGIGSPSAPHAEWPAPASSRATYDFNPGSRAIITDPTNAPRLDFDDAAWAPVTLPRAWNDDAAFKVAIDQHLHGPTLQSPSWSRGYRSGCRCSVGCPGI